MGGPQDVRNSVIVEDRDRTTPFVEIQERLDPGAIGETLVAVGLAQLAPSLTYGLPTAAGGMLRPTTPARTISVSRYGSAPKKLLYRLG